MRVAKVSVASLPSTLLLATLLLSLAAPVAHAGVIDPAYEAYLNTLPGDQKVSVLIYLADQAPLTQMDAELRAERATLAVRHETVITSLMDKAAETQPALLAELEARKNAGEVGGYTPYWIANLVVAQMTVSAVREVAARPEVGVVYANFTVSLIEPVGGTKEGVAPPVAATTPGVRAINAPRVWSELGITGAGRLVCGLDTGVMGSHPALASRWRGAQPGIPWQWAWKDVLGTNTQFPTDTYWHGTHTMGTMVGLGVATQDTVGVAWGAQWIACNAINQSVGSEFDNDVIAAFQWIADPDGNPQTTGDVPDVVQNSWRINESFPGGYTDCDPRWWAVMDGCETAGCAVVFSAGNEGPSPQTIGSPPDRITTPTNAYAIGAVDATSYGFPYPIAGFSSRGPSGCDHVTMKPEVVGPGVSVWSSDNTGGYRFSDGTSMAGPHVSGIFALMREANPNLDVATMKQVIMDTARDEGTPGEDNTYGWGMVDAYAAVSFVLQGVGEMSGAVTHAVTGSPIAGATVTVVGANRSFTTNGAGQYHGFAPAGTFDVTASHPAFQTGTQQGVVISVGQPVTVDFALSPAPDAVPPAISAVTCFYATDDVVGPYVLAATITDNLNYIESATLYYRTGAPWNPVAMQALPDNRYQGSIPGQPLGTTVQWYIEARDAQLNVATDPPGGAGNPYAFTVAAATQVFADDGEADQGWTLGLPGDTATTGRWVREDPIPDSRPPLIYQPEDDHTPDPGVICFLTGNAPRGSPPGTNDVDNGCTTLLSPIFDLSNASEALVRYWRFYTNETQLDDVFSVDVSTDGGATWAPFERVGPGSRQPWLEVRQMIRCQVGLTSQMRLRFIACDGPPNNSLTEALVDDVFIGRFDLPSESVAGTAPGASGRFALTARPNPFNPATLVSYEVPERGKVRLRIYDVRGRLVRTLADGVAEAGRHTAVFDGRNDGGHDVASGTYFLELEAGGREISEKLSLVR